jgi:hypothetical protein
MVCAAGGRSPTRIRVDCFDLDRSAWVRLPDLPIATSGAGAAALADGRVVIMGGQDARETNIVNDAELLDQEVGGLDEGVETENRHVGADRRPSYGITDVHEEHHQRDGGENRAEEVDEQLAEQSNRLIGLDVHRTDARVDHAHPPGSHDDRAVTADRVQHEQVHHLVRAERDREQDERKHDGLYGPGDRGSGAHRVIAFTAAWYAF